MTNQSSTAATVSPATTAAQPMPPDAFLIQIAFGPLMAQALYATTKLGIPDLLAQKPQSVKELAATTKTDERALYRVLRSLASVGLYTETDPKVFAGTPYTELLRSDVPGSLRNAAIFTGEEWHWRVWGNLLHSLKTGKAAWGHVHGMEVFDYFAANPEHAEIFNRAMTDGSAGTGTVLTKAYDFSGFKTVADIAGGHGSTIAQILKANPDLKGILFDVAPVIAGADELLEQEGVADRVEKVAGDFFAAIPSGADAYMMKHIIHDWDDERAAKILKNINAVLPADGRVLIVEVVVPAGNEPHFSKLLDLEMLCSPGGVERTESEYSELLASAGLRLKRIIPTESPYSIIEAVKDNEAGR